jgi:hypothetical protein
VLLYANTMKHMDLCVSHLPSRIHPYLIHKPALFLISKDLKDVVWVWTAEAHGVMWGGGTDGKEEKRWVMRSGDTTWGCGELPTALKLQMDDWTRECGLHRPLWMGWAITTRSWWSSTETWVSAHTRLPIKEWTIRLQKEWGLAGWLVGEHMACMLHLREFQIDQWDIGLEQQQNQIKWEGTYSVHTKRVEENVLYTYDARRGEGGEGDGRSISRTVGVTGSVDLACAMFRSGMRMWCER